MSYHLEDFGSFMILGRTVKISNQPKKTVTRNKDMIIEVDPNGTYHIENTYVEYFIPVGATHTVVLVHGGGMCGNVWHTTPDGRPGWLQLLLQQKFAVYIVDTVERGRAGWCPLPGIWEGEPELRTAETAWEAFRIGDAAHFSARIPFEHQQFPVDYFDIFRSYDVPRWNCNTGRSAEGIIQLIEKIDGSCFVIGHSQGCDTVMRVLDQQSSKIDKVIIIEPAGFPQIKPVYDRPIKTMTVWGDYVNKSPFWKSMYDLSVKYQKTLSEQGFYVDFIDLPKQSILGNSHAMMMDNNNAVIADILIDWLKSLG